LRHDFETSRRLVTRAVERATRLADEAVATKRLLETWAKPPGDTPVSYPEIWNAAARELVRTARERDRELGVVAHELRQSLMAALAADRLRSVSANPQTVQRACEIVSRQLMHLSEMAEGLLEYSRLSFQAPAGRRRSISLAHVACDAVEVVISSAVERGQDLTISDDGGAVTVSCDPLRLRQAIVHLLQNAVRYTPDRGRIEVVVRNDGERVVVAVHDDGEGIALDRLEAIFDPFVRVSASGPGLGIGLAIARRIVELYDGTITAASDGPGRGSVFTLMLPRADAGREGQQT